MNKQRQDTILAECIEQLRTGATAAEWLARYGAEAAEIAPLLETARRLQRLQAFSLTARQRSQAKATLRAAMISQNQRSTQPTKPAPWRVRLPLPRLVRGVALAAMAAALLLVVVAGAVAASRPGGAAYPLRVAAERAPAFLQTTFEARAETELRVADRRLADVEQYLAATGMIESDALAALLSGDQAAASLGAAVVEAERAQIAAHVLTHARALATLAASARGDAQTALNAAAARALAIASSLEPDPQWPGTSPSPQTWPTATPRPTETPGYGQQPTATPRPTETPGYGQQPTATPRPTETPGYGQQPTATPRPTETPGYGQQPTATPRPTETPGYGQQPTATPRLTQTPGWGGQPTATSQATRTPGSGR